MSPIPDFSPPLISWSSINRYLIDIVTSRYGFLSARTFTTAYTYDAASNRKTLTDPENGLTTYGYDNLNRLNALQDFQLAPLRDLRMHPEVFLGPAHHLAFAPVAELAHDFRQGQPQCALYLDPHLGRNIINFS